VPFEPNKGMEGHFIPYEVLEETSSQPEEEKKEPPPKEEGEEK